MLLKAVMETKNVLTEVFMKKKQKIIRNDNEAAVID